MSIIHLECDEIIIRQPAPAGCGVVAHRRLSGVEDFYTALSAIWRPAPAGCRLVAHRRLAGVDDYNTAAAAIPSALASPCKTSICVFINK